MEGVLAVDDGGGLDPQHRRVVYGSLVYSYTTNKAGVIGNDVDVLSNRHLAFENRRGECTYDVRDEKLSD
jgi:hypothetical protein